MGLKVQTVVGDGGPGGSDNGGPAAVQPEDAARKRAAVELIRRHDRALRSTARRYSMCNEDAEDAYQRGIEILLAKAPTTDPRHLLPWTRTVIKHEALAVRKSRERTLGRPPGMSREDPDEDWVQLIPASGDSTDEIVETREKVARSKEALGTLKPQELKALTQLAEGFSYAEIATINSWTYTKVNRCVAEGRQRFRSVFRDSEAGERCHGFAPLLSAVCDGELSADRRAELEDHLAACGHCRATLRTYRAAPRAAAALAPVFPISHSLWDRLQEAFVSAQVRLGGLGGGSGDSATSAVAATGGTRGLGTAALAKMLAVCVGTAGGAAACVATGVVPTPLIVDHPASSNHPAKEIPAPDTSQVPRLSAVAQANAAEVDTSQHQEAKTSSGKSTQNQDDNQTQTSDSATTTPAPTPTESEFTAESAGTAVPASAPPPPPAPVSTAPPVSSGGGEFAP